VLSANSLKAELLTQSHSFEYRYIADRFPHGLYSLRENIEKTASVKFVFDVPLLLNTALGYSKVKGGLYLLAIPTTTTQKENNNQNQCSYDYPGQPGRGWRIGNAGTGRR
jgi:hypothetical protein